MSNLTSRLRLMDIDDLFILRSLLEGQTVSETARSLGVTQPAVSQRLRKLAFVIGAKNVMTYHGRFAKMTEDGKVVAELAASALKILEQIPSSPQ